MATVVLLADNDDEYREVCHEYLELNGYEVREVRTPNETRTMLDQGGIDVAIIDVRLENDDDKEDRSGIEIALDSKYAHIAKIIHTGFPVTNDNASELLGIPLERLPPAVCIVSKPEIEDLHKHVGDLLRQGMQRVDTSDVKPLLTAVEQTLKTWPRLSRTANEVLDRLAEDHKRARSQARLTYWFTMVITLIGAVAVFVGVVLTYQGALEYGIAVAIAGVVETVAGVFFGRLNDANRRVDLLYHQEPREIHRLQLLLGNAEILPAARQADVQEYILRSVTTSWFLRGESAVSRNIVGEGSES